MKTLLAALLLGTVTLGQAPVKQVPAQGPPPKNLTQRPDGHFTANQDPASPEKFEVHVVKQGETLSQIAGDVLKNSRLWPQLWEQNDHIINPHWIYPNDKILIRPVIAITEAKPPEPAPEPAAPPPPAPPAPQPRPAAQPAPPPPAPPREAIMILDQRRPASEVKFEDLYCSGFVSTGTLPKDVKVISKFDATGGVLAAESDYVYVSHGAESGATVGTTYQVVRPTKTLTNPEGRTSKERDLGMHYLEIAQVKVALAQPDFSLARVVHNCGDAIEVGDIMIPFRPIVLPPRPRPRPFSPNMTVTSGVKAKIVSTKGVLLNFGSTFKGSRVTPGVPGNHMGGVERGIASEGTIVYLDAGQDKNVKPGDVFIVFRDVQLDERLYALPKEVSALKGKRTAIGELIILKAGERASTALVTYSTDALSLGDSAERR